MIRSRHPGLDGFARLCAAVPGGGVADVDRNRAHILELWKRADAQAATLVVFPELCLSSYSIRDLLLNDHLLERSSSSLEQLLDASRRLKSLALVGMPLRVGSSLYNVAVALQGGRPLAVIPKAYLPSYGEFEEARWFRPGREVSAGSEITLAGRTVPFGMDLLLAAAGLPELVVGIEICEDMWVQAPPSAAQVSAGATVVCNLSASNFTVGKAELRRLLARATSDRGKCAYLYVAAGPQESSTDMTFDADAFICENGRLLEESQRFSRDDQLVLCDIDLGRLQHERLCTSSFGDCASAQRRSFRTIAFEAAPPPPPLRRTVSPHPFLPAAEEQLAQRCWEAFELQSNALATRLHATGIRRLVLGLSGGLDSTHAALVAAHTLDLVGAPREALLSVTLPGFGTSRNTHTNARRLAASIGATIIEVEISEASRMVLSAVGHPAAQGVDSAEALVDKLRKDPTLGDITLENVQARLRTLVLMTIANQRKGLVVGTGDLSEKALGWSTYGGDHLSMYDVNAGVPKTLIRSLIRWVIDHHLGPSATRSESDLRELLEEILTTPISPELLPGDAAGEIAQLTESELGPYELHDFFLYHFVRHGASPKRILLLAQAAFGERYSLAKLRQTLRTFLGRFFGSQFKRSCTADAPKVGMVALSPRGDWRMPSDAQVTAWLDELED